MNTALIAPFAPSACAAAPFQFTLAARLLSMLQRVTAIGQESTPAVRQLDTGTTAWVARPLGRTVTCNTGTLWLTFDGEGLDVILEAGQTHRCAHASRLAIHALTAATATLG